MCTIVVLRLHQGSDDAQTGHVLFESGRSNTKDADVGAALPTIHLTELQAHASVTWRWPVKVPPQDLTAGVLLQVGAPKFAMLQCVVPEGAVHPM